MFINLNFKKKIFSSSDLISLNKAGEAIDAAISEMKLDGYYFKSRDQQANYIDRGTKLLFSCLDCELWGVRVGTTNYTKISNQLIKKGELQSDGATFIMGKEIYHNVSISKKNLSRIIKYYILAEKVIADW